MGGGWAALDNAPVESFFATLQLELIRDVVFPTRDQAGTAITPSTLSTQGLTPDLQRDCFNRARGNVGYRQGLDEGPGHALAAVVHQVYFQVAGLGANPVG